MVNKAQARGEGRHRGYEPTAIEGVRPLIEVIAESGFHVSINGETLDPRALALEAEGLVPNTLPRFSRSC
jgi:hypothetical protein